MFFFLESSGGCRTGGFEIVADEDVTGGFADVAGGGGGV